MRFFYPCTLLIGEKKKKGWGLVEMSEGRGGVAKMWKAERVELRSVQRKCYI